MCNNELSLSLRCVYPEQYGSGGGGGGGGGGGALPLVPGAGAALQRWIMFGTLKKAASLQVALDNSNYADHMTTNSQRRQRRLGRGDASPCPTTAQGQTMRLSPRSVLSRLSPPRLQLRVAKYSESRNRIGRNTMTTVIVLCLVRLRTSHA